MPHCPSCNSERHSAPACWKCGSPLEYPAPGWEYPAMPNVALIRALAKEVGYAIGEHGSKERDLDLIATPWTEDAVGNHALVNRIAAGINARIVDLEHKPLGRIAVTLQINGYFKPIDLSVAPRG